MGGSEADYRKNSTDFFRKIKGTWSEMEPEKEEHPYEVVLRSFADEINGTDIRWFTNNTLTLTGVSLPEAADAIYAAKILYGQGLNPANAKATSESATFSELKVFRNTYVYADVAVGDKVKGAPLITAVQARIDMTAPTITLSLADGEKGTFADNILYDSPNVSDRFMISVTDDSGLKGSVTFDGTSLSSASMSEDGTTYVYTKDVRVGTSEKTITISASDKAGNRGQDVTIRVIPVDKELKFTVVPSYSDLNVNEDGQTNKRPGVTFAASSGSTLLPLAVMRTIASP